jgi:fatty-acid desaturase
VGRPLGQANTSQLIGGVADHAGKGYHNFYRLPARHRNRPLWYNFDPSVAITVIRLGLAEGLVDSIHDMVPG